MGSAKAWIGTSGWNYKHWAEGVFYPHGLKQGVWLRFFSQYFSSVEVNNTFYRLPEKRVFEAWRQNSPKNFIFSIKASRFFTHIKRLAQPEVSISKLFENAAGLGDKLGVVLFQLPPRWGFVPDRLAGMLDYLDQQTLLPGVRAALEIRDESWYTPACFKMLQAHNVALALADQPGFAADGPITANFVFVRRHGPGAMYASNYPEEFLQRDAASVRNWLSQERDVYLYFNNDLGGYAVRNALRLKEILGI